jgi:hypothetical protein
VTDHPGEQFSPDVDPDVEPDYTPEQGEEIPAQPDYDSEPGSQNEQHDQYGAETERVDPAEVEFGPEFAREPGAEHERPFVAESADDSQQDDQYDDAEPQGEAGHPLVEEVMGRLHDLREKPVGEHADVYADLHERLQTALVEADTDQGDSR